MIKSKFKTEILDEYLKTNNLTKSEFCKKVGISYYVLRKIYKQDGSVKVSRVLPILKELKILIADFTFIE